eukprot:m.855209 g.855209  ORF g.855209 m.855209 type:complete len:491 (-) comp23507_c0_seq3:186-1658(-)
MAEVDDIDLLSSLAVPAPGREPSPTKIVGTHETTTADGSEDTSVGAIDNKETLYCVCRKPYNEKTDALMIGCDHCDEWFHLDCVGISHEDVNDIASYACQACQSKNANFQTKYHNKRRRRARKNPTPPPPRCASNCCANPSTPPSRYCTEDCGLRQADRHLLQLLQQCTPPSTIDTCTSHADKESIAELNRLNAELTVVDSRLKELECLRNILDNHLKRVNELIYDDASATAAQPGVVPDNDVMIDCFSCGNTYGLQKAIVHMHKCYATIEAEVEVVGDKAEILDGCPVQAFCNAYDKTSGKYCRRLHSACPKHKPSGKYSSIRANAVCGYPFDGPLCVTVSATTTAAVENIADAPPITSFCLQKKRNCVTHSTWDKLHTTRFELETVQQFMYRTYLTAQMKDITGRMARRHTVASCVGHEVIRHTAADALEIHKRAVVAAKDLRESHAIASRSKVTNDMEKSQTTGLYTNKECSVAPCCVDCSVSDHNT